mgnify:CR=1 FL=1|jgi:hypothetical protein|tara:strand:+ start:727 stop:924 length:198 start_codon:yes stop_codon:yes gene_type:complete
MDAVADYLREKLTTTKNNLSETIATGSSENYADYKYQVGIIEGLTIAIEELKLAEKNLYEKGEED